VELNPLIVAALVSAQRRKAPEARIFAIEARGPWRGPSEIDVDGRRARIREVRSAFGLREVLHEFGGEGDLVILTDLERRTFGRENLARVALGRIEPVQPWPVVRFLFNVASIDPRLVGHSWLAERLLEAPAERRTVAGGTLDYETAWGIVLSDFGLSSIRPDEDEFLKAVSGPSFRRALDSLPKEGRLELRRIVQDSLDRFGVELLLASEGDHGHSLVAAGLVVPCLFDSGDEKAVMTRGKFIERFGTKNLDAVVAARWAKVSRRVLAACGDPKRIDRVRAEADELLSRGLDAAWLAEASDELPSSLPRRLLAVAREIESFLGGPFADASLEGVAAAVERVGRHVLGSQHAKRAEMALRLARWLASDRPAPKALSEAMRRYAESDCWTDRARFVLRDGESIPELRLAYRRLANAVFDARSSLGEFVGREAIGAKLPHGDLIGVEHVLGRIVAPLATQFPVAFVVMDGMSHAVALEVVASLERQHWIRYRPADAKAMPLAISVIPSVTEHSRTSLLCGELRTGGQHEERTGFAAFLAERKLGKPSGPVVLHKSSLDSSSDDIELAAQSDAKVVAFVVNAVDAQLDGSDQLMTEWNLATVPVLGRIVQACETAGRAIVLASDHGHVLEDESVAIAAPGQVKAARWRPAGETKPGELAAKGPRVMPAGGECIVAVGERIRYGAPHAGYHGGVSIQELACPLHVLIRAGNDEGLEGWTPIESTPPAWWNIDGAPSEIRKPLPPPARGRTRKAEPVDAAPGGLFAGAGTGWIAELLGSELFAQQRKLAGRAPLDVDTVRLLLDTFVAMGELGSPMVKTTIPAVAGRIGKSVGDTRTRISMLQTLLNIDGYDVLAAAERDSVTLDVALLKVQFELGGSGQ
jgi:hypothetical protein